MCFVTLPFIFLFISAIRKVQRLLYIVLNLCAVYFTLNQKNINTICLFFDHWRSVLLQNEVLIAVGNAENFGAYKTFLVLFTKPLPF